MSHVTHINQSCPTRAAEELSAADQDMDMHANRALEIVILPYTPAKFLKKSADH